MTMPLLLYLKSEGGKHWIARLAGWCDRRGGIFLFVIPLALALISLRGLFKADRSWADFLWYTIYFLIGYIMPADQRFTETFKRQGWIFLALWIVAFFGGVSLFVLALGYDPFPGHEPFSFMYVLYQIVWSIGSWSAVVFILSLGTKYLSFNHKVLAYGNEAVLPFYLFHQTIILVIGFFVIPVNMGILPKFLIITVISFPLILVLYEMVVRPFNAVRFFFGMRPEIKSKRDKKIERFGFRRNVTIS
jgi:glucan biosynthesis protein C